MKHNPIFLGVNIDHIATLRQARGTRYPDPLQAAHIAETAGADGVTIHLREDRRHIQERDVYLLKETLQTRMNLEMAVTEQMLAIASEIRPKHCCFVPEKREELTTEGGLNVLANQKNISKACQQLAELEIEVSLFIDPDEQQIDAAIACQVPAIELHTGDYVNANTDHDIKQSLQRLISAAQYAKQKGLIVNAGHGLHYHNVQAIAAIPEINELNIGHAIIACACFNGLAEAVTRMKELMLQARS